MTMLCQKGVGVLTIFPMFPTFFDRATFTMSLACSLLCFCSGFSFFHLFLSSPLLSPLLSSPALSITHTCTQQQTAHSKARNTQNTQRTDSAHTTHNHTQHSSVVLLDKSSVCGGFFDQGNERNQWRQHENTDSCLSRAKSG